MTETNITELAAFFPAGGKSKTEQRITGVPSLLKGETVAQAIERRANNARRIDEKLRQRRALKGKQT